MRRYLLLVSMVVLAVLGDSQVHAADFMILYSNDVRGTVEPCG